MAVLKARLRQDQGYCVWSRARQALLGVLEGKQQDPLVDLEEHEGKTSGVDYMVYVH